MKPAGVSEDANRGETSEKEVARAWDSNADSWAWQVRHGGDAFREFYNNPAFLQFIGDLSGKLVLDAGCGEGYNTRILARRGGKMIGADISTRMIELARQEEAREPLGIRYEISSYTDLGVFSDSSFDAAVSNMALMDGPNFPAAMSAIHRVLKPGGTLSFSMIHPCFLTKGFGWTYDESGKETGITVAQYFNDEPWVERWKFTKSPHAQAEPFAVPRFDRTLEYYINSVIDAGLVIRRIAEPRPSEEACREHPWLQRFRDHIPLFFYVRAEKPR